MAERQGNLRQMLGVLPRRERICWTGAVKLVLPEAGPPALFDLSADPEERRNLLVGRYVNRAGAVLAHALAARMIESCARMADGQGEALAASFQRKLRQVVRG